MERQQHLSDVLKGGMKEGDEEEMVGMEKGGVEKIHAGGRCRLLHRH